MGPERANLGPKRGLGGVGLRGLILGLRGLIWGLRGALGGTYGRLEIHPCVLQDIGPLGPLPKKAYFSSPKIL